MKRNDGHRPPKNENYGLLLLPPPQLGPSQMTSGEKQITAFQDGETWRQLRTTVSVILGSAGTRNDVIDTTLRLVHERLIPLFQRAAKEGIVLDLNPVSAW